MSVVQIGEVIGTLIVAVAGALLFVNGLRRLNTATATPLPPAMAGGVQHSNFGTVPSSNYGTAPETVKTEDGFFGGAIVPSGAATSTGSPSHPLPQAANNRSGSPLPVILLVLGLVLMGGAAYEGFNLWAHRSPIHMPDQLLGMDRADSDSPIGSALDGMDSEFDSAEMDHLQIAGYGDTTEFVMVVAGTFSEASPEQAQYLSAFEAGQDVTESDVTVQKVDAGPMGGTVRCGSSAANRSIAVCMWVDQESQGGDRVVGFALLGGVVAANPAQAMITVRAEIEN